MPDVPKVNIPIYRRPLLALIGAERGEVVTLEEIQEANKKMAEDLPKELPSKWKWASPFIKFFLRRNLIELGGFIATLMGGVSYLYSRIPNVLKWVGITLGSVGVIAMAVGKLFLGVKLNAKPAVDQGQDTDEAPEPEKARHGQTGSGIDEISPGTTDDTEADKKQLIASLNNTAKPFRDSTVYKLAELYDETKDKTILDALSERVVNDPKPDFKKHVIYRMAHIKDFSVVGVLISLIDKVTDLDLKETIMKELTSRDIYCGKIEPEIIKWFIQTATDKEKDVNVCKLAADRLSSLTMFNEKIKQDLDAADITKLKTCATSNKYKEEIREDVILSLGYLKEESLIPEMTKIAFNEGVNEPPKVRTRAVQFLGTLKVKEAVDELIALLNSDEDDGLRCQVASELGNIEDKKAIPALLEKFKIDRYQYVRSSCAESLGQLEAQEAKEALLNFFLTKTDNEDDNHVKSKIPYALRKICGVSILPEFEKVLQSECENQSICTSIIHQMSEIDEARSVLEKLRGGTYNEAIGKKYNLEATGALTDMDRRQKETTK